MRKSGTTFCDQYLPEKPSNKFVAWCKKMFALVFFQLSDKLDFSWTKNRKDVIRKIIFGVLKFVVTAGIVVALLYFFNFGGYVDKRDIVYLYVVFLAAIMILLLIGDTHRLTMSLYYAEDNKLLVTFPVSSTTLFFSKILNFFIFDFIKNLSLLIPVTVGFAAGGIILGQLSPIVLLWLWVPLIITSAIIVLLASLLSVPYLYIYRLNKAYPIIELIFFGIAAVAIIVGIVYLIGLIPEDIDLSSQSASIKASITNFLRQSPENFALFNFVGASMFGKLNISSYVLKGSCFVDCLIIFGVFAALFAICCFVIKPFFFHMMTKSFEFEKRIFDEPKANKKRLKYLSFVNKELVLNIRDIDISGSLLLVYILAPILLYFINSVFSAISTSLSGEIMTYAFNVLLMLVPYLASNSVIATLYSREGRAAYMKKTKPISLIFPLSSKVFVYIILSTCSIIASGVVFASFTKGSDLGSVCPALLTITIVLLQLAHMYYSATLDIMNPQNEAYATTGSSENNQNENRSTLVAFIGAILFAVISYALMVECHLYDGNYNIAFIKLLIIGIVAAASCFYLFVAKVKAYYYEK